MRLPRREPRSVYRVYSEEDYLDGAELLADWEADAPATGVSSGDAPIVDLAAAPAVDARVTDVEASQPAPKLRRFAVGAALAGAVVLVGGLIATAILPGRSAPRRGLAPRVLSAPGVSTAQALRTAVSSVRRSSAVSSVRRSSAAAERRSAHSQRPAPPRRGKAGATAPAQAASGAHGGPAPVAAEPGAPASSGPVPAVVVAPATAAAPVVAIAPSSAAAREFSPSSQLSAQIEFGFEHR